jgi:hypothetical protein
MVRNQLKISGCFNIIFGFIVVSSAYSRTTISGRIFDSETREPLPYANIFLSGTTIGTASDQYGFFMMSNVPRGQFNLVAKYIGYQMKVIPVQIINQKTLSFRIRLKLEPIEGEEIFVEAPDPKWWRKRLKEFKREFFGPTDYALKCKLVNPEVLDFDVIPPPGIIRSNYIARTDSALIVENRATGYRLFLYFGFFKWGDFDTSSYH